MTSIVSMQDVGKRYVKYEDVPLLVTRALRFSAKHRRTHLWAVRHIDLEVAPGECIGVIGRNGAGKTSMLRMLAGVTAPTEGVLRVRGRVAPLISVGIGFHKELTGRENVYVNGTILGLAKKEIDRLLDSIVDFAEIGDFIDTPVKFYSSGMFVRLGFSVAVASDPEVLLVDEVLAVGDLNFQRKCYERMEQIRLGGATVLVVSHNLNAIRTICSRAMLLNAGIALYTGKVDEAISRYHDIIGQEGLEERGEDATTVRVTNFVLLDAAGTQTSNIKPDEDVTFRVEAQFSHDIDQPVIQLKIHSEAGQLVYKDNNPVHVRRPVAAGAILRCDVRLRAPLPTGTYTARATVVSGVSKDTSHAAFSRGLNFFVAGRPTVKGAADLGGRFELSSPGPASDGDPAPISPERSRDPQLEP
jgi:ABC-type polysaccharide/polyol phosphate transport system ATPase subunit